MNDQAISVYWKLVQDQCMAWSWISKNERRIRICEWIDSLSFFTLAWIDRIERLEREMRCCLELDLNGDSLDLVFMCNRFAFGKYHIIWN